MGHLTRIANTVVHNLEKGPVHTQISSLIAGVCGNMHIFPQVYLFLKAADLVFVLAELPQDCRGRWETFVDQTLSEANRKNTIDLVNMHLLAFCDDTQILKQV